MRTPVIVDAPYPTMAETAKLMGVRLSRAREIEKIVSEIHERNEKKRRSRRVKSRQPKAA
jgi:hypothetical protein